MLSRVVIIIYSLFVMMKMSRDEAHTSPVLSLTDCRKLDAKRFSLCICVRGMEDVTATRGSFQHLQNHRKQICTGARSCLASFPSCSRRASNERRTQRADFRRRDIRISQSLTDVSPCRPNLSPADRLQRGLAVSSLHTPCINATHFSWKQSQAQGGGASNNQPPFSLHRLL